MAVHHHLATIDGSRQLKIAQCKLAISPYDIARVLGFSISTPIFKAHPSLHSLRVQTLLTLFSECFSSFPHGTSLLPDFLEYLAFGDKRHHLYTPLPKCTTSTTLLCDRTAGWTGLSPSQVMYSKCT